MEQYILKSSDIIREMKQTIKAKRESSTKHCEPEVAQVLRKKANSLYSSRKLTEALSLYTQSLRVSSENSEDANLAFGNRSAVNFHLKEFKLSLKDIDNVLESNTAPPALLKKLLLRKARCLDSIECDGQEVLQTCEEIERLSREQTIPTLSTSERELLDNLKSSGTATSQEDDITVYQTAHPSLPSASSVLEMKHSQTKGRYLQVKADTPSGSVLICEQPYVMVLLPQYWDTHCYHCLQLVHTVPVFCRSSSCKVKYCSVKCKTQSYNYHQFECKDLNTIVDTGIGHLACSVITHTGYKTLLNHRSRLMENPKQVTSSLTGYDAIYNLVPNEEHIQPADDYKYKKTALALVLCLLDSQFFPPEVSSLEDTDVVYVASLLLRHIRQLICNAHAITHMESSAEHGSCPSTMTERKLASAIYPTASLMNHSCKPNITASFVGSSLVVKNSVDLKIGAEVCNCYGPQYKKMEKSERQKSLKTQYYFDCDCVPCKQEESISFYKCLCCVECQGRALLVSESRARCHDCHVEYDASRQVAQLIDYKRLLDSIEAFSPAQAIKALRKARETLASGVVHKNSIEIAELLDREAYYHSIIGNRNLSAENLMASIAILEKIYDEGSIELGREYHKVSEVLYNAGDCSQALSFATKAKSVYTLHFSQDNELVKDISKLCLGLKELL